MSPQNKPSRRSGWGRFLWMTVGALIVLALIGGGMFAGWHWLGGRAPAHTAQQQHTYTHPIDRIEVKLDSGSVELRPDGSRQVAVERSLTWSDDRPTYKEEWQGNTLRISTHCTGRRCSLDYRIQVPASVAVEAYTSAGDIKSSSLKGNQKLSSDSGDVRVADAAGRLSASSDSGDVVGTGLSSAQTDSRTDSGNLTLNYTKAPQKVTAKGSSGSVNVTVPHGGQGYRVQADTDSGEKQIQVAQDSGSGHIITAHTDSGDVGVRYA